MPGGRAQKPGDVQIAMSGKSIEVINTDAEGRLILADGIAYARQLGATHLVDAATLTGAIVVALGAVNTGVFGTNDAFTDKFSPALRRPAKKCGICHSMTIIATRSRAPSPTFKTLVAAARGDHGRLVSARIYRRYSLGTPRYCRHRMAR